MIGLSELNSDPNKRVQESIFIGDPEKCARIYQKGRTTQRLKVTESKNILLETAQKLGVNLPENNAIGG